MEISRQSYHAEIAGRPHCGAQEWNPAASQISLVPQARLVRGAFFIDLQGKCASGRLIARMQAR